MVECPNCGGIVDEGVAACPHCGAATAGRHGQQPRNQPQEGPAGGRDTSRRTLLKYGGGLSAVGVGGVLLFDAVTGPGGPAETVASFYDAVDAGNLGKARRLFHSESPQRGVFSTTGVLLSASGGSAAATFSVDSLTVVDRSDRTATVETDVTMTVRQDGGSTDHSFSQRIDLRTEGGDWRIYRIETTST